MYKQVHYDLKSRMPNPITYFKVPHKLISLILSEVHLQRLWDLPLERYSKLAVYELSFFTQMRKNKKAPSLDAGVTQEQLLCAAKGVELKPGCRDTLQHAR